MRLLPDTAGEVYPLDQPQNPRKTHCSFSTPGAKPDLKQHPGRKEKCYISKGRKSQPRRKRISFTQASLKKSGRLSEESVSNLVFYPVEKTPRSPPAKTPPHPHPTSLRPCNCSWLGPPRPSFLKQPNLPPSSVLGRVQGAEGCNAQGFGSPALPPHPSTLQEERKSYSVFCSAVNSRTPLVLSIWVESLL